MILVVARSAKRESDFIDLVEISLRGIVEHLALQEPLQQFAHVEIPAR